MGQVRSSGSGLGYTGGVSLHQHHRAAECKPVLQLLPLHQFTPTLAEARGCILLLWLSRYAQRQSYACHNIVHAEPPFTPVAEWQVRDELPHCRQQLKLIVPRTMSNTCTADMSRLKEDSTKTHTRSSRLQERFCFIQKVLYST
jgi:hypothetical protein